MKKMFLIILLAVLGNISFSQVLLDENFNYTAGDTLGSHNWTWHSGASNYIPIVSGSLSYTGYPNSGIGNMVKLVNTGEDMNRTFAEQTSGAVYASFLVKVDSANTAGDYFFHFAPVFPTTLFKARVYAQKNANGSLQFGISKQSGTASYTDPVYTFGTTYLLVVKYTFLPSADDDIISLWVNPTISNIEPTPTVIYNTVIVGSDAASLAAVALRQGSTTPYLNFDGLRVTNSWSQILPVELTSFTASSVNSGVQLNWATATEINNRGFQIERKSSNTNWVPVGFVQGKGTTTEAQKYSFVDKVQNGKYSYRLKQIDFNGNSEYSKSVEVDFNGLDYSLMQNYPNPFNPTTSIKFTLAKTGNVSLKVYNLIGQEVKSMVSGMMEAGTHSVDFNATGLNSGIYFYKLETEGFSQVRKMTLMK